MRILFILIVLFVAALILFWMVRSRFTTRKYDYAQEKRRLETEIDLADDELDVLELREQLELLEDRNRRRKTHKEET